MQPTISVILVSYNTVDLLPACLDALLSQGRELEQLFVVDNDSADGSAELVRNRYPEVQLIANQENLGFGAANNQALARCRSDLVFFLNPDTRVHPDCLAAIRRSMAAEQQLGLAGVRITDPDGSCHHSTEPSYPGSSYSRGLHDDLPGEIAWVLGAGMVARQGLMTQLGGFDERFFLYGEDIDLCLRVRQAGYRLGLIEDAVITHLEGQSERSTTPAAVLEKKIRAELLFFRLHYPPELRQRIVRARRLQAWWRLLSLRCLPPLPGREELRRLKLAKYRLVAQLYRSFSHEMRHESSTDP
ncbi:glycosyltransferase family 2 protein [Desulfogranum mediterraneum]|uniref:glycosyltransferase family 2 protein n=1 Tax=Desulfogranum mediterraneum TaxID=160661 RepID=UPI000421A631|nr:glycosyltransferase family 2 protein [Desulfogranum mediterraneum]